MAPSKKGVYVGRQLEIHGPTEWPGQEDDPKVAGKVTEYQEESKGRIERACIWHACACVTLVSLRTSILVTYVTYKVWHGCRGF